MFKSFIIVLVLCTSTSILAKDLNGSFAVKGVGTLGCKDFLQAARTKATVLQQYAGYLSGYISAYNEINDSTFDVLPWQQLDTVMLLLVQSCKQTPDSSLAGAVSRVTQYFATNKLDENTQKIEIKGPKQSLLFYPAVIEHIKSALSAKGYDTKDLWVAMKKFQKDNNLPDTNPFSQLILMKLLYGEK